MSNFELYVVTDIDMGVTTFSNVAEAEVSETGLLTLTDEDDALVAFYAPTRWVSVAVATPPPAP